VMPLRIGDPAQFRELRDLFHGAGFTVEGVCKRTGCSDMYSFQTLDEGRPGSEEVVDSLDLLIRLFMDSVALPLPGIEGLLPDGLLDVLRELDLVERDPVDDGRIRATVLLYPVEGLWITSDTRWIPPDPDESGPIDRVDVVYPAITGSGRIFQQSLPRDPAERFLELCAGTGIAALMAATRGGNAWAVDITARSTHFARFNAALNGLDNVTALQGDLYSPVEGLRFDRIVAHPPYVPAAKTQIIYRDGGRDGEEITRRIIQGLPRFLAPGGRFYCTCVMSDRKDAPLESRIRELLGEEEQEFDVALFTSATSSLEEDFAERLRVRSLSPREVEALRELFASLGVERIVGGTMVIQRRAGPRKTFTFRKSAGEGFRPGWLEWTLRWETEATHPGMVERVLDSAPRVAEGVRVHIVNRLADGEWVGESARVLARLPFPFAMDATPDALRFLSRCDGTVTVRDHVHRMKESGVMPEELPREEFAELVMGLVGGGVLTIPGFPHPPEGEIMAPAPLAS